MTNYDNYAETFSDSRKNMKWEEIDYFIEKYSENIIKKDILDVGCGNGRFLTNLKEKNIDFKSYLGIDNSKGLLEEAKKLNPRNNFQELDMINLYNLPSLPGRGLRGGFSSIFFIASFHHLKTFDERLDTLKQAYNKLCEGGYIFMTNWALNSKLNKEKYQESIVQGSKNEFNSLDYQIKIGQFSRYYHCFNPDELDKLSQQAGFKIIENKLFKNNRNYILILKKA